MDDFHEARTRYGLSVEEAAHIMGVSLDTWKLYEEGRYPAGAWKEFHRRSRTFVDVFRPRGREPLPVEEWYLPVLPTPHMINSARRWTRETTRESAARVDVAAGTWSLWESGKNNMPLNRWLKFLESIRKSPTP